MDSRTATGNIGVSATLRAFYILKPLIPRAVQIQLRRWRASRLRKRYQQVWPIDIRAADESHRGERWPNEKRFAVVLTHDVEDCRFAGRCSSIMAWEHELGFKSAFNLVPMKCQSMEHLRSSITSKGFEIGVHGLLHDGKLYRSEGVFQDRAAHINGYLKSWGAVGFRSPAMQHNLDWLRRLDIQYDSSTFDTDPFQPQSDGVQSLWPFFVDGGEEKRRYVELPCTLPQDFTLFIEMREQAIDLWVKKLDWIAETGGMALINTHPDYMWFGEGRRRMEEYPARHYRELLQYVSSHYRNEYWAALPREVAAYWYARADASSPS